MTITTKAAGSKLNANRAGIAVGAIIGGWHLLWSFLVALGWAQPVIDFIFWMHFIKSVYVVGTFNAGIAIVLIVITGGIGYGIGCVFAVLWNRLHR